MTGRELADRIGVTYRQVDYWTTKRYLRAEAANPGSGVSRDYSKREVRVAEHMASLVKQGLAPAAAARVARQIERKGAGRLGGFVISQRKAS